MHSLIREDYLHPVLGVVITLCRYLAVCCLYTYTHTQTGSEWTGLDIDGRQDRRRDRQYYFT